MNETPIQLQQQRSFSEKINATFEFIRQNFKPLFKSLIYIAGPPLLIVGIYSGVVQSNFSMDIDESNPFAGMAQLYASLTPIIILSYLTTTLVIAIVYGYLMLYNRDSTDTITPAMVWNEVKKEYFQLLVAAIVASIIISIGFLFFFIPGVFLGAALSLIFIIQMRENKGFGNAFQRCFYLISGNYLSTIGLLFVIFILYILIAVLFGLPSTILGGVEGFLVASESESLRESSIVFKISFILAQVLSTLGNQLAYAVVLIAVAFQYFNLVEKKEATGLIESINTIGDKGRADDHDETY